MEKSITPRFLSLLGLIFLYSFSLAQEESLESQLFEDLFSNEEELHIKLNYNQKLLKKNTKDSIYTVSLLSFQNTDSSWQIIDIQLKARGAFRRQQCYFPPVKMKIKKSARKGSLFENHKRLKLVLPCKKEKEANDALMKEYLIYKMFEFMSPYHFKTRLLKIEFHEERGKKFNDFSLLGFFIEDEKVMAKRYDGKMVNRYIHPLTQEPASSVRNALFQYMIGNVDFSTGYQHNMKLIYSDKKLIPIPYDFDMSGFVDPSYGVLPNIDDVDLGIENIRQRVYRGFVRDENVMQHVRTIFISGQEDIYEILDSYESKFSNPKEFRTAKKYLLDFYKVIESDKRFENEIIDFARIK